MGLSSSLWTSVSGLLAHGEKMNVVGNNLANVSTIGFKSQRMDFEDFVYKNQYTASGGDQVGLGVGINAIITDFSQGSFESTNNATDLAINGGGFFKVENTTTGQDYYTRAGNFNFNNEGYLTLPSGEVLQGWKVNNFDDPLPATGINPVISKSTGIQTVGEATDILLDSWTVLPKATTKVEFSVNLTAEEDLDSSPSVDNPLFAMSEAWDGKHAVDNPGDPAISEDAYVYPAPIKVYDESGREHTLTAYFDQVPDDAIDGLPTGYSIYEYMLTMNPEEDARTFGGTYDPVTGVLTGGQTFQDTEAAGMLMKGTMIFNAAGELVTQTSYTYMGNTENDPTNTTTGGTIGGGATDPDDVIKDAKDAGDAEVAAKQTDIDNAADTAADTAATAIETAVTNAGGAVATAAAAAAKNEYENGGDVAAVIAAATGVAGITAGEIAAITTAVTKAYADPPVNGRIHQQVRDDAYDAERDAVYDTAYDTYYNANIGATLGHPDSALSWQPTAVSDSGYPVFVANFSGHPLGNSVRQTKLDTDTTNSKDGEDLLIEFDLGLQSENPLTPWAFGGNPANTVTVGDGTSIADVMNPAAGGTATAPLEYTDLAALVPSEGSAGSSTNLGTSSSINFSSQNGYTSGNLTNVRVDSEGVLYGIYSNNVEKPLYQVAMYDFVNPQGLYREGGNLYSETRESGSIQQAQAGIAGMGYINAYNIEQSNVDMAREFVHMISTQRGFQSNSKGITTVDMMLEQVINMKR